MKSTRDQLIYFNQQNRDAWVAQMARELAPKSYVLDLGAGVCRYKKLFEHCQYQAMDFAQYGGTADGLMAEHWDYQDIHCVGDASAIPMRTGSFDVVLCTEVLEHVTEPIKVLGEISRVLRIGGTALITAPLGSGLHQQPYHFYGGFTPYFYQRFLAEFGFQIVALEPNGRFFRMLLQEVHRAIAIIQSHRHYRFWHPYRWFIALVASTWLARLLTKLDDEIPVDEFTVGYHVKATKVS